MPTDRAPVHQPLSPDDRFREVAAVLALGLRALRDRAALPPLAEGPAGQEKAVNCLEVSAESRLSVQGG